MLLLKRLSYGIFEFSSGRMKLDDIEVKQVPVFLAEIVFFLNI